MFELTNNPALKPDSESHVIAKADEDIDLPSFKKWVEKAFCVGI